MTHRRATAGSRCSGHKGPRLLFELLRSYSDTILAGEFREEYSPTILLPCLGTPFLNVF